MAGIADKIYFALPVWAQQAAVAAWGVGWYRRRYGHLFQTYVREFHERDFWTREQFHDYQQTHLKTILDAAWNSPYYQEVFTKAGLRKEMDPWEALRQAPFLTKEVQRTRADDLVTERPLPRGTMTLHTSGSTGTPAKVYYPRYFHANQTAVGEARSVNFGGQTYRDRRVMFGARKVCRFNQSRPPFWRYSPIENLAYASIYHLSPRHLPAYLRFLRKYRPGVVMGYPSALATVASYALENDDLPAPAKTIVTMSETLTQHAREAIEAAWQAKLYDRYGAVEGDSFASQCELGAYHLSPEVGIVEILDAGGNACPAGVLGEIVATGLQNALQPLIRRRTGDMACWAEEQRCPCGRQTAILQNIAGRHEDMCYAADGRGVLRFDTVFKGVFTIREAQVVQEDIDRFVIYVVPAEGFGESDIATLQSNMQLHIGDVTTSVEQVEAIPRSSSGKFRAVLCKLSPEQRQGIVSRATAP